MSQEYEKDRTVKHKNNKATLPNIASPDTMDISEAECPDETSHVEMEKGVNDINDDKDKKMMRKKGQNAPMTLLLLILMKMYVI